MRINLQLEYSNGTKRLVTCSASDLVAFENQFNVSVMRLGDDPRIGWLLYLAWHSEKRTGNTSDDYEKWLDTVETVGDSDADPKSKA
jgi:hypothetical protein